MVATPPLLHNGSALTEERCNTEWNRPVLLAAKSELNDNTRLQAGSARSG